MLDQFLLYLPAGSGSLECAPRVYAICRPELGWAQTAYLHAAMRTRTYACVYVHITNRAGNVPAQEERSATLLWTHNVAWVQAKRAWVPAKPEPTGRGLRNLLNPHRVGSGKARTHAPWVQGKPAPTGRGFRESLNPRNVGSGKAGTHGAWVQEKPTPTGRGFRESLNPRKAGTHAPWVRGEPGRRSWVSGVL